MRVYRIMIKNNHPKLETYVLPASISKRIVFDTWDEDTYWTDSYDKASSVLLAKISNDLKILTKKIQEQQVLLTETIDLIVEYKELQL